jgi:hypothetical protein
VCLEIITVIIFPMEALKSTISCDSISAYVFAILECSVLALSSLKSTSCFQLIPSGFMQRQFLCSSIEMSTHDCVAVTYMKE